MPHSPAMRTSGFGLRDARFAFQPFLAASRLLAQPAGPPANPPALPNDDPNPPIPWEEQDIVQLHWRLLQEVGHLADPDKPLEDKLDTLRWVFTEREKEDLPFSFVNCLRVVGCSPLSPVAYCGLVDAEEIRDRIRANLKPWLAATLERYPQWVRAALRENPLWVEEQLTRNPQWINQQIRQRSVQGDLFA